MLITTIYCSIVYSEASIDQTTSLYIYMSYRQGANYIELQPFIYIYIYIYININILIY